MTLSDQIQTLIAQNERLKSRIEWIEWYQTKGNAEREIAKIDSEIAFLRKRREAVILNRDDTSTIPRDRQTSQAIVKKILALEEEDKRRREATNRAMTNIKDSRRLGAMSVEKSLEFATNLGMSLDELKRLLGAA